MLVGPPKAGSRARQPSLLPFRFLTSRKFLHPDQGKPVESRGRKASRLLFVGTRVPPRRRRTTSVGLPGYSSWQLQPAFQFERFESRRFAMKENYGVIWV